jgi:PAS domain S-box-containing protein
MASALPPQDHRLSALADHVARMETNLERLGLRVHRRAGTRDPLVEATVEEISAAIESLRAAYEELRLQGEQLLLSQRTLEEARREYQELFDFAPDAYIVTDAEGIIRRANSAVSALVGYARRYVIGKPLVTLVHPSASRRFLLNLQRLQTGAGDGVEEWEMLFRARRREPPIDVAVRVAPMRDRGGTLTGLLWLLRDITRQKAQAAHWADQEHRHAQELRTRTMELEAIVRMQATELRAERTAHDTYRNTVRRSAEDAVGRLHRDGASAEARARTAQSLLDAADGARRPAVRLVPDTDMVAAPDAAS